MHAALVASLSLTTALHPRAASDTALAAFGSASSESVNAFYRHHAVVDVCSLGRITLIGTTSGSVTLKMKLAHWISNGLLELTLEAVGLRVADSFAATATEQMDIQGGAFSYDGSVHSNTLLRLSLAAAPPPNNTFLLRLVAGAPSLAHVHLVQLWCR